MKAGNTTNECSFVSANKYPRCGNFKMQKHRAVGVWCAGDAGEKEEPEKKDREKHQAEEQLYSISRISLTRSLSELT